MITEQEHNQIEQIKNVADTNTKQHNLLKTIFERETNKKINNCGCSNIKRKMLKQTFYNWYNTAYPTTTND